MRTLRGSEHALTREQNLKRLLDAQVPLDAAPTEEGIKECRKIASRMPLAHSRNLNLIGPMIESDSLSPDSAFHLTEAHSSLECRECLLETKDDVFTYAGPFRYNRLDSDSYNDVGILFEPLLESAASNAIATPFDSGGMFKYMRPNLTREEQVAFVLAHELPVPSFRYLLGHYLAHCFEQPFSYLRNEAPTYWPVQIEGGDERGRTFEVRFPGTVSLRANILAVFYPPSIQNLGVPFLEKLASWRANQIRLIVYNRKRGFNDLQRKCVEFLSAHLSV